ncbi:MAG: TrmH family RNA methyltransferase [Patescibacteria group bacterium]
MKNSPKICLLLHNIRSAHNVGAIFRTAEAAGVEKIYLIGYTPPPIDRFGRASRAIAKTALGAEKFIEWERYSRASLLFWKLKAKNYKLIALEQSPDSIDYRQVKITGPTAIIVGNEVRGLPRSILNKGEVIAEIPMGGKKESLNVSVATGIFLFQLLN